MQAENPVGLGGSEICRILTHNRMMRTMGLLGAPVNDSLSENPPIFPTEMPQARSVAASRNHKEAEKRRRERINSHLNELRKLLPCNSKTDKASLLGRVVQHMRELKQQTADIAGSDLIPAETDEIAVLSGEVSGHGQSTFKASVCCEDRSDLLPDLIETLKSLRLKTLRAEMATLGGRVRNVLVVAGEGDEFSSQESVVFLREALKALVERPDSDRCKRRRIFNLDRRNYPMQNND